MLGCCTFMKLMLIHLRPAQIRIHHEGAGRYAFHVNADAVGRLDGISGQNLMRWPVGCDPAVAQQHEALGEAAGEAKIMQGDQRYDAPAFRDPLYQFHHLELAPEIERARGLVEQKDLRIAYKSLGHADELLLPA